MQFKNLLSADSTYNQSPLLNMISSGVENRYAYEIRKLHAKSLEAVLATSAAVCLTLAGWLSEWRLYMLAISLCALSLRLTDVSVRLLGICPAILLEAVIIDSGTFGELLGGLLFTSLLSKLYHRLLLRGDLAVTPWLGAHRCDCIGDF